MANYYLAVPQVATYAETACINIPNRMTVDWGLGEYAIKFRIRIYSGSGNNSINLGIATGDGTSCCSVQISGLTASGALAYLQIRGRSTSTYQTVYTSSAGSILQDGLWHTYEYYHTAAGVITFYRDGVLLQTASFTTPIATEITRGINQLFKTANGVVVRNFDLDYLEYAGFGNGDKWIANLSNGTGNILPSVSGTNNGTQVGLWPADDSEWQSLDSPVSIALAKGTYTVTSKTPVLSVGSIVSQQKQSGSISGKALSGQIASSLNITKRDYEHSTKQLSSVIGFGGNINSSQLALATKYPTMTVGNNSVVVKGNLQVTGKAFDSVDTASWYGAVDKTSYQYNSKSLYLNAGTSLSFNKDLHKLELQINGKTLQGVLGVIPEIERSNIILNLKQQDLTIKYPTIPVEQVIKLHSHEFIRKLDDSLKVFTLTETI
jgi:hypothetical protein